MGRPKKSEHQKLNPPRRQMKRKRNDLHVHFSSYVFRVLKQVHPQLSMTNKAMKVMDDFMHDIFHRLADEAAGLMKVANRSTLTSAEIQTATRLILPGELSKHAVIEATKSLATFIRSRADVRQTSKSTTNHTNASMRHQAIPDEAIEIEILRPTQMDTTDVMSVTDVQTTKDSSIVEKNSEGEELVSVTNTTVPDAVDMEITVAPEEMDIVLEAKSSPKTSTDVNELEEESSKVELAETNFESHEKDQSLDSKDDEDSSEVDEGYRTFQEDPEVSAGDSPIPMDCTTKSKPLALKADDRGGQKQNEAEKSGLIPESGTVVKANMKAVLECTSTKGISTDLVNDAEKQTAR